MRLYMSVKDTGNKDGAGAGQDFTGWPGFIAGHRGRLKPGPVRSRACETFCAVFQKVQYAPVPQLKPCPD